MLISIDAGQIEWRVAVELSKDRIGMDELIHNLDMHVNNQHAFNLPSRHIAKIYLFRTIYRGSGYSFSVDPNFSPVSSSSKFWDGINEQFYQKYSGLNELHMEWARTVSAGQPILSPFGREWVIPMETDRMGGPKMPWTKFTNYPVQGTAADIMVLVRLLLKQRITHAGIKHLFISTVHDSIVLDIPNEDDLQQIADIAFGVFRDLPDYIRQIFKYGWVTPLTCEVVYGPNMKDMQEIKESA